MSPNKYNDAEAGDGAPHHGRGRQILIYPAVSWPPWWEVV